MAFEVKKAKRQRRPLKINLEGVSGSGKTFSALRLAFAMRRAGIGKRIVVADSENESAGLYEGVVQDGERWEYDVCPMPSEKQNPLGYVEAYEFLVAEGFDVIIGDSLTHAWYGAQEIVDRIAAANRNDKFGGWATVTPQQRKMLATLTDGRAHFIGTMRVKSEYERVQKDGGSGTVIKKVGTRSDQREGAEYEFDCVARLDKGDVPTDHVIWVDKVRGCTAMDGRRGVNPGPDFWKPLFDWWLSAEPETPLHERHAASIRAAKDIDALRAVMERVNADAKAQRLSVDQIAALGRIKDERKVQLVAPAPVAPAGEGEDRADPSSAPAGNAPTAGKSNASAASDPAAAVTDLAPKPMPAADRRTAPAKPPENPAFPLLELMHELDLSWPEIRDARGKGLDVSNAAGLGKLPPQTRVTDLDDSARGRLFRELESRVAQKRQRAKQREANKARREAEAAAEEVSAS